MARAQPHQLGKSKRSFCPNCEAPIAWYDNIPIISWLVLGAKCRHCKEPIAVRYPIVEALGGLSFLAVTLGRYSARIRHGYCRNSTYSQRFRS
ncbi:MAG: prepilin peptidase [Bifidobacterium sp.]